MFLVIFNRFPLQICMGIIDIKSHGTALDGVSTFLSWQLGKF